MEEQRHQHRSRVGGRQVSENDLDQPAQGDQIGAAARMGARHLRESEQTEWGRALSVMGVELDG